VAEAATVREAVTRVKLAGGGGEQEQCPVVTGPGSQRAAKGRPGQGEQRGAERKARGAGEREAGEHHVAGHVGDEDPAQPQDADGIDQASGQHCREPAGPFDI